MSNYSQLAETLIGSEIVKLGNMIGERLQAGETIYNYTIGDFDPAFFPIPSELKEAIAEAYKNDYTNYPPAEGIRALRESVSGFVQDWHQLEYGIDEILIASGGRPLIYAMFRALVDPGDKVIYAVPSWNNNHYTHMNGGEHCVIEASPENDFMPAPEDIRPHLGGASLLCLCSPQNPTGTTLSKEALESICDMVLAENARRGSDEKKLYVMYDQMYALLTYGENRHYNPVSLRPGMKAYTVFIDGISKCFSATGVRVGWSLGPAPLIGKMKALLSHIGAWAPMAEQVATAQFLPQSAVVGKFMQHLKSELEERLLAFYHGITALRKKGYPVDAIAPRGALYLTMKIDVAGKAAGDKMLAQQSDVTDYLLDAARMAVVPFYAFGAGPSSPWYRLSVGTCDKAQIQQALNDLERALEGLK